MFTVELEQVQKFRARAYESKAFGLRFYLLIKIQLSVTFKLRALSGLVGN